MRKAVRDAVVQKKRWILFFPVFLLPLGLAWYLQEQGSQLETDGSIARNPAGGETRVIEMYLQAEGLAEEYLYELEVEPEKITEDMAENLFLLAEQEIEASVFAEGDTTEHVEKDLKLAYSYAKELVEVEWYFDDYSCITAEGELLKEELREPMLVTMGIEMYCGDYYRRIDRPIRLVPAEKNAAERLIDGIREKLRLQHEEGGDRLVLPAEAEGEALSWREKKEPYVWRVLFLEIVVLLLLRLSAEERRAEDKKKRMAQIEREYPKVVSRLAVLLEAGLSTKAAIGQIAQSYRTKKEKTGAESPLQEEILTMYRAMCDGEGDRETYLKFGERSGCACCLRLSRLLVQNLQKGNARLCELLSAEAENAFEEQKLAARKAGEEAGTKLLLPLLLMMLVVMAIVIAPAWIGFSL